MTPDREQRSQDPHHQDPEGDLRQRRVQPRLHLQRGGGRGRAGNLF